ncbi:MAG: ectoine/hydroxyectoine ABC transporter permease subunit EhuD [Nocardioidaceae bacterium]
MDWNNDFAIKILPKLLDGLWGTVKLTMLSMIIALVVGLLVAVIRYLKIPVISGILTFYVLFVRGTPLLVQAYAAFFILPSYGITLSAFKTAVIVLGLNYSAYTAEVYRSGIEGLPAGQWEAATALSLPTRRTWSKIVLPQSVKTIIPVLGNYWIQMFKDSAILSAITYTELMLAAKSIGSSDFRYLEPFTIAGLMYLVVSYAASLIVKATERRYAPTH